MKKFIFLFGVLLPLISYSQQTGKDGFYNEPVEFADYVNQDVLNGFYENEQSLTQLNFNSERPWTVYSDREDNSVYDKFNGSRTIAKLDFLQPLFVKEIRGSWLQVYSMKKKEIGWINVKYLVICRYAMLNRGTAAPRKGMALISLNEDVDPEKLENSDLLQYPYYLNPDLNSGSFRGKSDKFRIYFVLKETESALLLSETDKLTENRKQNQSAVIGWMRNLNITNWNTRVCLEPSTSRKAVSKYNGSVIPVFANESDLEGMYLRPEPTENAIMKNIVSDTLLSPYIMRMPILEHISRKKKKVATVGKLNYEISNNTDGDINCLAEIGKIEEKLRNINIVFVIDGTQSMRKFYPPVVASITELIKDPSIDIDANIRFGAIIYRDYLDGNDAYNVYPLTNDYEEITTKLVHTPTFSSNPDLPEAQYNGLINGIPGVGFEEGQTNIVILIGDVGNRDPDKQGYTLEKAINVMEPYDVSFIAFQVAQGPDFPYITFNLDSKGFIDGVFSNKKTEVSKSTGTLIPSPIIPNTFQYVMDDNIEITNLYGFGRFTFANRDKPMSTSELKRNVRDAIESNLDALQEKLINWKALCGDGAGSIKNNGARGGKYEEELLRNLARKMATKTGKSYEKCIEALRKVGEFSFVGYTSTEFYSTGVSCYENVVYLSQTEFDDLTDVFNRLLQRRGSNSTKRQFKEALSQQVKSVLGSDMDQSYIDQLTLEEVWNIILSLPFDKDFKYGQVGTTRLKDLVNMKDPNFDLFYDDYIRKIQGFGPAKYEKDRSFKMGGTRHYWVPLNDFPGNG